MLIHPWDAATPEAWRPWLAEGRDFGQLVANNAGWPVVVPTHFAIEDDHTLLVHCARANPVRAAIEGDPRVVLTVLDDYAYVPSTWRAAPAQPAEDGVPTSYYAAVQFHCHAQLIDDPQEKSALLTTQLRQLQPEGGHAPVDPHGGPYHHLLSGIFGIRLEVAEVRAKFKYDDHKPADFRQRVSARLAERNRVHDQGARTRQQERLARDTGVAR